MMTLHWLWTGCLRGRQKRLQQKKPPQKRLLQKKSKLGEAGSAKLSLRDQQQSVLNNAKSTNEILPLAVT